jgi:tripartite-type tricarboxylate transporter receptor subunit TctC
VVGRVAFNSTMLVVNARMPVNSATELAALTRQNPGRITIAITGIGSVSHLGRNGRAEPVLLGEVFGCRDLQS